jgi:hypothetical protein
MIRFSFDALLHTLGHCMWSSCNGHAAPNINRHEVNLWRGFGVKENPGGDWSLMREHIRDVLASGDDASDRYLIRWIAWGFQNPTKAAEVAIALMSKEKGTGKGILGRALCRIYGGHGVQLVQRSHLVGKFNAHMAMCGFLFSDEAIWPGFKEDEAVLKALITEPTLQIERKGVDAFTMPNALKIMLASNSERVVPVLARACDSISAEADLWHRKDG